MPAPDVTLEDGTPLWRESSVRTWWLKRGQALPEEASGARRYHQQWAEAQLQPALLEERLLHLNLSAERRPTITHVRVYEGMDGQGPVVILGIIGVLFPEDFGLHHAAELKALVSRELLSDVDLRPTVWVTVHADYFDLHYEAGAAPSVAVRDLADPTVPVLAADIARLIGRPFDVYPDQHYTERTVAVRQASGAQDHSVGTEVVIDEAGLGAWVDRLRTIVPALEGHPEMRFAAGVIAGECLRKHNDVVAAMQMYGYATWEVQEPVDGTITAVYVTRRRLAPIEMRLCRTHALAEPLEKRLPNDDIEARKPDDPWTMVSDEAVDELLRLRRILWDVNLAEESPVREALTAAHDLLRDAIWSARPAFKQQDRGTARVSFSAESPETQAWIAQLQPVSDSDLRTIEDGRLQRGARLLIASKPDWIDTVLLYDASAHTVALVGTELSAYTPDTAREHVTVWRLPGERLTPSQIETEIAGLLRSRRRVVLDWPLSPNADLYDGVRVTAPSLGWDNPERPVYVVDHHGIRHLLPAQSVASYWGFVWGVSSTDTISPAIYDLVTADPLYPTHRDDDLTAFETRRKALDWLRHTVAVAGPLDVNLTRIREEFLARGLVPRT